VIRLVSNVSAVAWKEAALLRHDKAFLSMIVAQPIMMFLLFGFALSNEPANLPWAVLDQDGSAASRRLVSEIAATGYFRAPEPVASREQGAERLRRGEALGFLVLPRDLARDLERGEPAVELLLDGSDPLQAARLAGIVTAVAGAARESAEARSPPLEIRGHVRFNPTLEDHVFFLSILAGMLLTNLCISVTSLGLVAERETGTYEQTLALPTTPIEIVLGKLVPHVVVSYGMLAFATIAPGLVFGFWPRGSLVALVVVTLPFVLASLSIGALVSILSRTSAQSVFITVFAIMPSMVLSGVMLPYQLMPEGVREIGFLFPLRWYQIALRRIVIRGADLADVWLPTLALFGMFAVVLTVIRWRLKPRLA
jgi:ABC-2 type transport system permease protein